MASKSYRKFMATGLSAAVVASVVAPVAGAAAYDDVKEGAWYEEAINYVTEMEYMKGTGKGFEPGSDMTRAQAAQLFANILGLDGKGLKADFSDVKEGAWYYEAIAAVKEHGVMSGSGAKFNPNATLTRGEMAAIIVRAYDLKDHEGRDHSFTDIEGNLFKTEIAILADLGIVDGVSAGKFAPKAEVTRAQMASFIFKTEVPPFEFPAVKAVKAVDTKTVEVTVDGAWTQEDVDALVEAGYELTVEGKASHKVGKVTVKAAEASTSADTTTLVLSEIAPELVAGEALSLAVNGDKIEGSEFKVEAAPAVTSVSAINTQNKAVAITAVPVNGTLKLQLSNEVNKDTVNVNNVRVYKVEGNIPFALNTADVSLSTDGKTIMVDASTAFERNTEYKVVVNGVKDTKGANVSESTTTFKTSTDAVVSSVFGTAVTNDTAVNLSAGSFNVDSTLNIVVDGGLLAAETVNSANITITDITTGERTPVVATANGSTITLTLKGALVTGKQYKVAINNVKTLTGYNVEAFELGFTADASAPTVSSVPTTLGGTPLATNSVTTGVWGKLSSGVNEAGVYAPGIQFTTTFATKLDQSTLAGNFVLVEKATNAVVDTQLTYNADAKMVTLVPKADLKEKTTYVIKVKRGLTSDKGIALGSANEKSYEFSTQDLTAPSVTSVTSKNGDASLKVTDSQEFTVKFSEALLAFTGAANNGGTLQNGQVALVKAGVNTSALTAADIVSASVQPVVGQDGTYKVTVAANTLERNQAYKLVVFGKGAAVTVKDAANANTLSSNYIYTFTTEGQDVTAPTLTKVFKGDSLAAANEITTLTNVAAGQKFTLQFNEELGNLAGVLNGSNQVAVEKWTANGWVAANAGTTVTIASKTDANNKITATTVTLSAIHADDKDAKLRLVVDNASTGLRDVFGNIVKEKAYFEFISTAGDDTASSVDVKTGSVTNGTFAGSTAVDKNIYISFDEDQLQEVTASSIKVTDKDGNLVAGTLQEVTEIPTGLVPAGFSGTNKVFVFNPTADLSADAVYTVTAENIKDTIGNTIAKKVVQFQTAAASVEVTSSSVVDGAQAVDRLKSIKVTLNQTASLVVDADAVYSDQNFAEGELRLEDEDGALVDGLEVSGTGAVKTVTFDELDANANYVLKVKVAGGTETIRFTTGAISTDDIKPTVSTLNGASFTSNGVHDLNLTTSDVLSLAFSEDISLTGATVAITNVSASPVSGIESTFTESVAGTLTINPFVNLDDDTTYKVVVSGVKDASGNAADTITFFVK
ncbi:MAG: Ig-like domain-containing protein [Bacillota bacterium]